jgi:glucose/arabinose dehydrogenase
MPATTRERSSGPRGHRPDHAPHRRAPRRVLATVAAAVLVATAAACTGGGSSGAESGEPTVPSSVTTTTSPLPPDPGPGPMEITARLATRTVVDGLQVPVAMAPRPGTGELWVAEQGGRVRRVQPARADGTDPTVPGGGTLAERRYTLDPAPVLDLGGLTQASGERGLLGIAFAADGRRVYVQHTLPSGDIVVAEYRVPADGPIDAGSRRVLLTIPHRDNANHNGGQLAIGPDGFLYVGVGDGGGQGDPANRAQDPTQLLGKILRIDPDGATLERPYGIPASNPFTANGAAEIFLLGARNPWRFSFDRTTRDLWVADVGQSQVEEVNWLPAAFGGGIGANLGWNWFEGDQPYRTGATPPENLVKPIFTYSNTGDNCSIIGGYVYRGEAIPELQGTYVFGDYCGGEVRGVLARNGVLLDEGPLGPDLGQGLLSFGQDASGELYVLTAAGALLRLEAA